MIVETLIVSPFATNCFVVGCPETGEGAVIDPGDDAPSIVEAARSHDINVKKIFLTHGHTDHVSAASGVKEATGAEVFIHEKDVPLLREAGRMATSFGWDVGDIPEPDGFLVEGEPVTVGNLSFDVLHTPGHSPGGVCFVAPGIAFVGDTLFAGSIGRTDLPGGSFEMIIRMIKEKILTLPPDTQVLTGHGPATTVAQEAASNPFLTGASGFVY
jgi:glyoxylase-like metal-dependent hydrolase (beta-lactamase superfamily II)